MLTLEFILSLVCMCGARWLVKKAFRHPAKSGTVSDGINHPEALRVADSQPNADQPRGCRHAGQSGPILGAERQGLKGRQVSQSR